MPTAVRIQTLDSASQPVANVNFERYEIENTRVLPVDDESFEQESQSGDPTLFLLKDPWHVINIRVRIHGASTEAKLTVIRNFIRAGGIVRVFPKYFSGDIDDFYDCYIRPESIPINSLFSGESRANEIVSLVFRETDQASQYIVSEDIVIS